jgi:hypothetical protein
VILSASKISCNARTDVVAGMPVAVIICWQADHLLKAQPPGRGAIPGDDIDLGIGQQLGSLNSALLLN